MIPILSIVGTSDSGKTTLIEKLVPELSRRGWRVATVKHDVHAFEMDREGKDSFRHKAAGAVAVIVSSPSRIGLIEDVDHDHSLRELAERFHLDADLLVSEGYKRESNSKIEVFRMGHRPDLLCGPNDGLVGIASDVPIQRGVPCVHIDDAAGLADLVESTVLAGRRPSQG
jgi:molybdopterin-guanine dinucleotide biosynthesis adapter protein